MVATFLDDNNREFLQRLRRTAKKTVGLDSGDVKESMTLFEKRRGRRPRCHGIVYLTCAVIGLGGRGVIKTWTEVAARMRLYMLTSDLTSLFPPQFSHWLQVRKVGTVYLFI